MVTTLIIMSQVGRKHVLRKASFILLFSLVIFTSNVFAVGSAKKHEATIERECDILYEEMFDILGEIDAKLNLIDPKDENIDVLFFEESENSILLTLDELGLCPRSVEGKYSNEAIDYLIHYIYSFILIELHRFSSHGKIPRITWLKSFLSLHVHLQNLIQNEKDF